MISVILSLGNAWHVLHEFFIISIGICSEKRNVWDYHDNLYQLVENVLNVYERFANFQFIWLIKNIEIAKKYIFIESKEKTQSHCWSI